MKRLIAATLALSLLDATAALAQDHPQDRGHPAPAPAPRGGGGGGEGGRGGWAGRAAPGGRAPAPAFQERSGPSPYVPQGHGDRPHPDGMAPSGPPASHLGRSFGAPGFEAGAADRPRYSPEYFPHQIQSARHFHWSGGQVWRGQPDFYYRQWHYGDFLPGGWFGADYWINDWGYYDLPVPPYGYEWVRVGPDALLVDPYTGEVVSTVYGLFY